jgi:hypothetical protein
MSRLIESPATASAASAAAAVDAGIEPSITQYNTVDA